MKMKHLRLHHHMSCDLQVGTEKQEVDRRDLDRMRHDQYRMVLLPDLDNHQQPVDLMVPGHMVQNLVVADSNDRHQLDHNLLMNCHIFQLVLIWLVSSMCHYFHDRAFRNFHTVLVRILYHHDLGSDIELNFLRCNQQQQEVSLHLDLLQVVVVVVFDHIGQSVENNRLL